MPDKPPRPLKLRADVTAADTEGATVLLDGRSGRYYQLNATGALVLRDLLAGAAPGEIAGRLAATRPVTTERARADVAALLDHLTRAGLVVPA
ncbi:lasso peptide biosynthesis PqqD family chaperone [Streptomyces radicis]|uniref:lasso peptide biosynthesis PqqD family chaperone n=1 Tax=Streptomyces radicis TaxID=1750517 RepID=UPI001E386DCE|nr:lasso peptide biosynthesis PqqD family chaperone [Streptomyces radicis]